MTNQERDRASGTGDVQPPSGGRGGAAATEDGIGGFGGQDSAAASDDRPAGPGETASGSPDSGPADVGPSTESVDQLDALQAELETLNDRHLRLAAEFDNYRKRINREREEVRQRAEAELVAKLLDPLDDLRRVASFELDSTSAALLEGVRLVEKKLRRSLEAAGLERVEAEGEFFNPETMEAVMTAPAERSEEDEMVDEVFQSGYRFRGILIRPARVRVKKLGG